MTIGPADRVNVSVPKLLGDDDDREEPAFPAIRCRLDVGRAHRPRLSNWRS